MRGQLTAHLPEQLCPTSAVLRSSNHGPGSVLPQQAQRSTATSTTDKSSSQVSKYSPQTALSLTTCWFPLQDALGKLFNGKHFREKDRGRAERKRIKQDEAEERENDMKQRKRRGCRKGGRGDKKEIGHRDLYSLTE